LNKTAYTGDMFQIRVLTDELKSQQLRYQCKNLKIYGSGATELILGRQFDPKNKHLQI